MLKVTSQLLLKSYWCPLKAIVRHHPYPIKFQHYLQNIQPMKYTKLLNGVTVVTDERPTCNVCVGIYVDAGPRYESDFESGITHFFEHIAFKGTCARSKTMLEDQMSCMGARFKCFTTREMSGYYAECLTKDLTLCVDILTDCIFNNAFSEEEIEEQKRVVYSEMLENEKNINGLVEDYLHITAFQGTPLARTILGLSSNLYNFNQKTISTYRNRYYDGNRTVLAAVGGMSHEHLLALAYQYMSRLEPTKCMEVDPYRFTGSEIRYRNDLMPVANVAIAVEGPCLCDEDNVVMEVAANLIGGWDRSQPGGVDHAFNVARDTSTNNYCDAYKAFNINYKDTGLWGVQIVGPTLTLDETVSSIQGNWMNLCNTVTEREVERAKRITKTKILSKEESMTATCHDIAKWVMYHGFRAPLQERICAVDRISAVDVNEVCTRYLWDKCPAVAAIGPTEGLPCYARIRAGMYWLRM